MKTCNKNWKNPNKTETKIETKIETKKFK